MPWPGPRRLDCPVQYLFLVILIGALGVGLVVLTSMGLAQRRRRRLLARVAHEMGLKFSPTDPFDIPRRYPEFVLACAGHSPRAENVIHGQHEGWNLRAFDFYFEAGHGPRRRAGHYSVLAADTGLDMSPALIWHAGDREHVPLAARVSTGTIGPWRVCWGEGFAPAVAEAFGTWTDERVNVQTLRQSVILYSADVWKWRLVPNYIAKAAAALQALADRAPSQ